MKKPTFLAIIPARCGSKGIKDKNIYPLLGKPLIAWSIDAALHAEYITKTVVSSDCDKILSVAKEYGAHPIKRPEALATDTAPSEPLILDVIEQLEQRGESYDYIVLLQPTSPLRNSDDIDEAIKRLLQTGADALISVYEPSHSPYKAFIRNENGFLRGIVDNDKPFMRRQDLPPVYFTNGAIYIIDTSIFKDTKRLFCERTIPYIMSAKKSVDIDTLDDIKRAEKSLESLRKESLD